MIETIEATVVDTVFRNEENGYSVVTVKVGKTRTSAVGVMPELGAGEKLSITGEWVEHPQYGKQIKVSAVQVEAPTTLSGIEKYLASGLIQGVGPATARLLVQTFGKKTLDVLQFEPERLLDITGIGPKRAQMIAESFAEQAQQREALVFLQTYGVPASLAVKIFKVYGERVQEVIRKNPYQLVDDVTGVGFKTADSIAVSLGIAHESEYRLCAGVKYALMDAANGSGHTYLPRDVLTARAQRILNVDESLIDTAIDSLIISSQLIAQTLADPDGQECVAVYLPLYFQAEGEVARRLREMLAAMPAGGFEDVERQIDQLEGTEGIRFHEQQRLAIKTAVQNGMCVITGGPGTGKTTIINCIIRLLSLEGDVALAAPTGRAAKRMTEATGVEAKTIHRLLEYGGEEGVFARGMDNPLEFDTLIVDEMSMVDIFLMRSLLRALLPGTRLIMVGDADQLPSVGAGNVLSDILASGAVPSVRLTEIFRQDEASMIVVNAHRINHGQSPILNKKGSDFFFERRVLASQAAQTIVELCARRIPGFLQVDPVRQIQVLSPTKKGECGVWALNALLQQTFNPARPGRHERVHGDTTFREGDKVMQTRNNYQLEWKREGAFGWENGTGVFNGDMGFITGIDEEERSITVTFEDDRIATYEEGAVEDLELAYCISVHKSQGSEFPVVVLPAVGGPPMLLTRNLFYTAVTRARRMVMLVGREDAIDQMIRNAYVTRRYSALGQRLSVLHTL